MSRFSKEVLRKLLHLSMLLIIFGYGFLLNNFSERIAILALTAVLLILLEIEYFRIDYQNKKTEEINKLFVRYLLRRHEANNLVGATFFCISTIISFSAYDYSIAFLSLLLAVFGDTAAAIIGTLYGSKKIFRNKSYAGTLSGLLTNLITGFIVIPDLPIIFIPMALTATIVEMLTKKLDDNLTVPLFSGFIGQLIVFLNK